MHSLILPCCANVHNPKSESHLDEPKIRFSSSHCPLPPENSFSDALLSLRARAESENPKLGSCLHAQILKAGLESDVFVGNSLQSIYSKFGQLKDAENLFDHMPHRTTVSWTSMMSAYHRHGLEDEAILLLFRMLDYYLQPNEFTLAVLLQACALKGDEALFEVIRCYAIKTGLMSDRFLQSSLIDAYATSGMLTAAEKLMQRLYIRDVFSWTSIISGCVRHGNAKRALALFSSMQEDGVDPNYVMMLTVLQACSDINNFKILQWIHALVFKGNWCMNDLILNSLIEMYSINGHFFESMEIFIHFCFNNNGLYPNPETMANLLQGCGYYGTLKLGEEIHGYLIKHGFLPCTIVETSLINMYTKNRCKYSGFLLFRTMVRRDIISWNTIINCFVKNDRPFGALRLFGEIHGEGWRDNISPDFVTVLTSLEACSNLALLVQGQAIHGYLTRTGLLGDIFSKML